MIVLKQIVQETKKKKKKKKALQLKYTKGFLSYW